MTSRQGSETLWNEMVVEQKLCLKPLGFNHAIIALFRRKEKLLSSRVSNDGVAETLEQLRNSNQVEYKALCDLASNKEEWGMPGRPLALTQAGSFVNKRMKYFAAYLSLYKAMRNGPEEQRLLTEVEENRLENPQQQTVLITWKISTETLTKLAESLLKAFALFESSPVPRKLVECLDMTLIDDELKFDEAVQGELVHGTSLLHEIEIEYGTEYEMHHMVRQFIVPETRLDESCFHDSLVRAIKALQTCGRVALISIGDSFS